MRQWAVAPVVLCDRHLLGEHLEAHMFATAVQRGTSLLGYISNNLVAVHTLRERHDALVDEMRRRGINHYTPFPDVALYRTQPPDAQASLADLLKRCPLCAARYTKHSS